MLLMLLMLYNKNYCPSQSNSQEGQIQDSQPTKNTVAHIYTPKKCCVAQLSTHAAFMSCLVSGKR